MTNQLTPQQLLEIARVVEPEIIWQIESKDLIIGVRKIKGDYIPQGAYEPHKNTERGQAQLMRVVFAVAKLNRLKETTTLAECLVMRDVNGILKLAHEVLCND